jgi:DNA-binding IclR family transcriptional regulator
MSEHDIDTTEHDSFDNPPLLATNARMNPRPPASSADRLLAVLQLFTPERPEWTVETAAKEVGVSVSTAYRYFRSLCRVGLLDPYAGGHYVLGPAIIEYDRQIRIGDPLVKVARPLMQEMIAKAGHVGVALLCRVFRNRVMCVHQETEGWPDRTVGYERGRPMPLFRGASSKIIFSHLPSRSARWLFQRYPGEIEQSGLGADWESVKASLRRIRGAGICVTRAEVDNGRVGLASPVFEPSGKVLGSIGLVIPADMATAEHVEHVSGLVRAAGRSMDAALQAQARHEVGAPSDGASRALRDAADTGSL